MEDSYKILLVEDDEAHRDLIFRAFESYLSSIQLIWANCLSTARTLIDKEEPHLVLSDWKLLDGEGIELLKVSKDRFPLLLMTGFGNQELAVKAMKAGVTDYIVKSFESILKLPVIIMRALREWENIVARREAENALARSEERYRLAVEGANDIIWDWDIEKDEFFLSREISGDGQGLNHREKNTFVQFTSIIHPEDKEATVAKIEKHLNGYSEYYISECRVKIDDSNYKWMLFRGKALRGGGENVKRMAGSLTDITGRKDYEKRIVELAYYDTTTGLPNRARLLEKLEESLKGLKEKSGLGAVYYIDMDDFKFINDIFGHLFGDLLLKVIGTELRSKLGDEYLLARLGGDEFVVVLDNANCEERLEQFAKDILAVFKDEISVSGQNFKITVSIGIALYPTNAKTVEEILKNADMAVYKAKKAGKNQYVFYDESMNNEMIAKVEFEKMLRTAIAKDEFVLYYQPQVNLSTGKLYGLEGLLRWKNPVCGMVPPMKFIRIAEETGLIVPIGLWVLKNACCFIRKLYQKGIRNICISVNVSAVQLIQSDFADVFEKYILESGIPPDMLGLELTESCMVESFDTNIEKLVRLKKIGIKILLDDFGTGYSSLNYLNKLPIDVVKIDKSFIDNITDKGNYHKLTNSVVELAHNLGVQVIAEGVERDEQAQLLTQIKCDIIQGYLISRPIPEMDIVKFINLARE